MNARAQNHITGRLSLRPPQAESLSRLARALDAAPELLSHERDVASILSTLKAEFACGANGTRRCCGRWRRSGRG
jgi:type III restriction enzyme